MANEPEYKLTIKSEMIVDGHAISTVQETYPTTKELHEFLEKVFWFKLGQVLEDDDEEDYEEW